MRKIKKYANGRLYDTSLKDYITRDKIAELINTGEEITVVETKTGNDVTREFIAKYGQNDQDGGDQGHPLLQIFRKGSDSVVEQLKNSSAFLRSSLSMAEEEIDRIINILIRDKKISKVDANRLKEEMKGFTGNLKKLISEGIDHRINQTLQAMNLATKEQVLDLTDKIEKLGRKIQKIDKKASK